MVVIAVTSRNSAPDCAGVPPDMVLEVVASIDTDVDTNCSCHCLSFVLLGVSLD